MAEAHRSIRDLAALGGRVLIESDADYPAPLRASSDPPLVLFAHGTLEPGDDPAVAIVGARNATPEGRRIARALAEGLGALGITVVSGLARGIDGSAHFGSLEAGGRTLAVLAAGLDVVYPREHADLARRIAGGGALLSEFPLGTRPERHHFPIRNRVIAALARVVVVVEAADRSGSLITARLANEDGRAVLAVPGSPLSPTHHGTNALIRDGARILLGLEDVLEEIPRALRSPQQPARTLAGEGLTNVTVKSERHLTDTEDMILRALDEPRGRSVDELAQHAQLPVPAIASMLLTLEVDGLTERLAGGRHRRTSLAPRRESGASRQDRVHHAMVESSLTDQESK